jgi:hypothetical protein
MALLDLFRASYYYLDLLVGFSAPFVFWFLYRNKRIDRFLWHFFWIGVAVGLTWEIPIFVLSGESTSLPLVTWERPLLTHYSIFMISHSLWDGMLFVIGVWLIYGLCPAPHLQRFRGSELMVLVLWGQVSELLVELSSTFNDGWAFVPYGWNPVLFHCNDHPITWLMQVIWLVASIVYYALLIGLRPRYE